MRARGRAVAAALAAMVAAIACHASFSTQEPIPIKPIAAPVTVTIVGALSLPAGEQVRTEVVERDGTRTALAMSSGMLEGLGPGAKTGAQVRVIGEPATLNGAPAIRVTSIALVP